MKEVIQAQNIFEYKRALQLAESINSQLYLYLPNTEHGQIIKWCEELSERVQTLSKLEPINDIDRMIIEMASDGDTKDECIKAYRKLTDASDSDAKDRVETICGDLLFIYDCYRAEGELIDDVDATWPNT
ncbi:MAG: hypothetical protein ABIJ59_03435 [Pseudomonadota bacterium]